MPSEDDDDLYVCALSGKTSKPETAADDDDPMGDTPVGWVRLTLTRRLPNPEWHRYNDAKEAAIAGQIMQIPADAPADRRAAAESLIRAGADASFFAALADTDRFLSVSQEVFISDPTVDPQVREAWKAFSEALGLPLA